jgi:O-antigen/teichoic acid export membrane protein
MPSEVTPSEQRASTSETDNAASSRRAILATAKGGGFLAGGSVVEFASRFVISFLLARLIAADGYGLYNLAISAATIFAGISALGLDDAMVRYIAIQNRRGDPPGLWGTLQIGVGVSTVAGVVMGTVLYLAATPIAEGVFDEPRLTPLLHLLAFVVPFLTISNVLTGCARGFGRMDHAALGENVVQHVVRIVLLVVLTFTGLDVFTAVAVFAISDVASSGTLLVLLNRQFPLRRSLRRNVRRDAREVFSFALPLWLSGLLNQFRKNIETVMLGALTAMADVGIYAVVTRINLASHVIYRAIIVSVKPVIAALSDERDHAGLTRVYTAATRWTLTLNIPFFLISVLYPEPILLIFGETFTAGATALIVLAAGELVVAGTGICGSLIDMTGHTRLKLGNTVLWIVLLLASNALLIPRWGLLGAATASLIATGTINIVRLVEVWIVERLTPYRDGFWKPVLAATTALGVGFGLQALWPADAIGTAMAQGATVVALYASLILALGIAPEDRLVFERVMRKLRVPRRRSSVPHAAAPADGDLSEQELTHRDA